MPRRPIRRLVAGLPPASLYKPAGVPMRRLETIELAVDELEAMRLVDQEGLSHEEAAHYLGVSRQTVGRVVESARRKVTDALLGGKALAAARSAVRAGPWATTRRRRATTDALRAARRASGSAAASGRAATVMPPCRAAVPAAGTAREAAAAPAGGARERAAARARARAASEAPIGRAAERVAGCP
jgi:predicted DNA-binding protein (UPF0251 family)